MPNPHQSPKAVMPESLRLQLADFRRHLWRVKIQEAIAAGMIGLLLSFLLVYGLDRILPTPGWARLLILVSGFSLFGLFAPYWIHRWVWRQRRETQLARLIAKRYPGLGDRLLGVIELQDQEGNADTLSPRLREAAMEAVAIETGNRKLAEALPVQRHRKWALAALVLATASAIAFTVTPRAGINALQRWLMPLSNTERYTFTKLDNPPTYRAVAFGEAFDVNLRLSNESEQKPQAASGRYGLQPGLETRLQNNSYLFHFPGQQDPGTIVFRIGDLRHELRIEPVPRPAAESLNATIALPEYLGIPDRTVDLKSGVLTAVEGSKVCIEFVMSRPLASGEFGPTRGTASDTGPKLPEHTPMQGPLTISGRSAKTPFIHIGESPFEMPVSWTDQLGLAGDSGFHLRVDALKDMPPTCYLQGVDRQKIMLPEETVDFEILAEDDFGVKATGIEWSGQFTRPTDEPAAKGELLLAKGNPEERRMLKPAAFSPAALGISPQKITLRAWAEDQLPNRARVYSDPIVIYVLTRDEHAQLLKNRFDRQITELEDLARRELNLLEENQRLEQLDGEKLQKNENTKRLENQQQEEAETKRRMDELTERMEQLMKDAARNGDIDKKTLQKMAESLKSMQELSQQDVPKVQEKLGDSQEQSNTPEKTKKDVKEAVEQQKKVVDKMHEAIDKANEANRRFEAGTFVNRLKKAASEESGITSSLKEAFNRPNPKDGILGVIPKKLDPSDARRLSDNSNQQAQTAADVRWIQEDLGHFFTRTQTEVYKQIMTEMRESQIDIGLESIRTALTSSHTFQAAKQSDEWAKKLNEWAKKLEGDKDDNGGGGGGGGSPDSENEDFEFMLRVMKMVQQEQDLRGRTRVLEQFRRDIPDKKSNPTRP